MNWMQKAKRLQECEIDHLDGSCYSWNKLHKFLKILSWWIKGLERKFCIENPKSQHTRRCYLEKSWVLTSFVQKSCECLILIKKYKILINGTDPRLFHTGCNFIHWQLQQTKVFEDGLNRAMEDEERVPKDLDFEAKRLARDLALLHLNIKSDSALKFGPCVRG